jgi:CelD/BcsL family acetyltransferase involved in cellulose biosynthesis
MLDTVGELALSVIEDEREFAMLRSPWQAVFNSSRDRSVYLTWEWSYTWWRHFGGRDRLHVLVVRQGSDVVAIAPLLETSLGPRGWGRRMLIAIGQETADYGGFLLGERPDASGDLILDHLEQRVALGEVVILTRLREDSALLSLLRARFPPGRRGPALVQEFVEDYPFLDLTKTEDSAAHVSMAEKRNDVRRRLRRLRESHDVDFVYNAARPRASVQRFLALHHERWTAKDRSPSGLFVSGSGRAFLLDVAEALDASGYLRLSFVTADGAPIAARFGFEFDRTYFGVKSAFDPAFASFGPGHLMVALLLEEMVARGLREFDFLRGAAAHKAAWANGHRSVGYWTLRRRGWVRDRLLQLALRRRVRLRGG